MGMAMADGHTWQRYEGGHAFILMFVMSAAVPAVVPAVMSFLLLSMAGVIATFFGVYEPRLDDGGLLLINGIKRIVLTLVVLAEHSVGHLQKFVHALRKFKLLQLRLGEAAVVA